MIPSWLYRFLDDRAATEDPPPGVGRLWPERSPEELAALLDEQRRDNPFRR